MFLYVYINVNARDTGLAWLAGEVRFDEQLEKRRSDRGSDSTVVRIVPSLASS